MEAYGIYYVPRDPLMCCNDRSEYKSLQQPQFKTTPKLDMQTPIASSVQENENIGECFLFEIEKADSDNDIGIEETMPNPVPIDLLYDDSEFIINNERGLILNMKCMIFFFW